MVYKRKTSILLCEVAGVHYSDRTSLNRTSILNGDLNSLLEGYFKVTFGVRIKIKGVGMERSQVLSVLEYSEILLRL